jgi:hypothetical protein
MRVGRRLGRYLAATFGGELKQAFMTLKEAMLAAERTQAKDG